MDRVYQPPTENVVYDTDASKNLAPDQKESQNNKKRSADIDADSTKNRSKGGSKAKNKQKDLLEGIHISKEVRELIEDDAFEYKIPFKDPDDLLMNFTSLEEK